MTISPGTRLGEGSAELGGTEQSRTGQASTRRIATICPKCKRMVIRIEHPECYGDTRLSCAKFGCGRKIARWATVEMRPPARDTIGWCEEHAATV